ncbi:MAG: histidine kinase, partial [Sphingobacteriales bacterium]
MPLAAKIEDFIARHRVLSHILFWLLMYAILLGRFEPFDEPYDPFIYDMLGYFFSMCYSMLFAYFIGYRILPRLLRADNYIWIMAEFLLGSYIISALARTITVHVEEPMVRKRPFDQEPVWEIWTDIPKLIQSYFIHAISLALVFIFLKLIKDQYAVNRRALELKNQKAEKELNSLKEQLNPHFLFNTLNNIYSLSVLNSPKTSDSIARLSGILDHLIYKCSSMFVPVEQEIELLNNYIELEKLRYDERLKINFHHSIDRNANIAPLVLISLLENAFKHGAGEEAGNAYIDINLTLQKDNFSFEIKNSMGAVVQDKQSHGIGLINIKKQLELIYPVRHSFNTFIESDYFI